MTTMVDKYYKYDSDDDNDDNETCVVTVIFAGGR